MNFFDQNGAFLFVISFLFLINVIYQAILRQRLEQRFKDYSKNLSGVRGKLQNIENSLAEINSFVKRTQLAEKVGRTDTIIESDSVVKEEVSEEIFKDETEVEVPEIETVIPESELEEEIKTLEVLVPTSNFETGLTKTRQSFFGKLKNIFLKPKIDKESFDEIEQLLIEADLGVTFVTKLLTDLKSRTEITQDELLSFVKAEINNVLKEKKLDLSSNPAVILMLGVNGVGKTTTSAKLANLYKQQGKKVMLVAGDTFRAAAVEQIKVWGSRLDVDVVSGDENAKPQTVVYSAMEKAKQENYDLVIIDTAGRLHNKSNLMQELEGINNTIRKFSPNGADETLLVLDACTGQNALIQAKEFNEVVKLSGLVLTKLDGTPKGGIVVAINQEFGIPVSFLGIGEGVSELKEFSKSEFLEALFTEPKESVETSANAEVRRVRRAI